MFKARLDKTSDIISLDPNTSHGQLYEWARTARLTCPACSTEVRFNAGDQRRSPFFFHRSLLDCKYGEADPEVLAARACLYTFLETKVRSRGGKVTLEVRFEGAPPDDLVDVLVEFPASKPVAYRIFNHGIRPSRLQELDQITEQNNAIPRYLLTISRRRFDHPEDVSNDLAKLSVPPLDRHLFTARSWDQYHVQSLVPVRSNCLTYIDPGRETLVLYRGVERDWNCNPNVHTYLQEHQARLSEVRILKDGEFVFPDELHLKGEWEAWKTREKARLAQEAKERADQEAAHLARMKQRLDFEREQEKLAAIELKTRAKAFWAALRGEGETLLAGRPLDLPDANLYDLPAEEWHPRLLAMAYRLENPFAVEATVNWMRWQVGLSGPEDVRAEFEAMKSFWRAAAQRGFVKYEEQGQVTPLDHPKAFHWSVGPRTADSPHDSGMCVGCWNLVTNWMAYDPTIKVCKCRRCFGSGPRFRR